jgi:epoxyqueuosine reductase
MAIRRGKYTDYVKERIQAEARRLGFAACAFARAERMEADEARWREWLAAGQAGAMGYLHTPDRADARTLLENARTVVVCALAYDAAEGEPHGDAPHGRIARYARGEDYHVVLKDRLRALAGFVAQETEVAWRACVDTAPLLERAVAASAGLGFVAKNSMLITPGVGSYTLLGELLLSIELPPDAPQDSRCGRCVACIEKCPTGAIVADRVVDARRCISYLTIELDGPIPRELRPLVRDWVFGCDLCQEVCPFNASASDLVPPDLRPRPDRSRPSLRALLALNTNQFKRYVDRTAMRRVRRRQLLRNAAVALGNIGTKEDIPSLTMALTDREPLVRGHAAWALGRLGARDVLQAAREPDPYVQSEIAAALSTTSTSPR